MDDNPFVGAWSYRSFLNNPDLSVDVDTLLFGSGTIVIDEAPQQILVGTIGTVGQWGLTLKGSRQYGTPNRARFQGKGLNGGEEWIYDYECYLVPHWPNGVDQRPALVGSVIRTIPHSSGDTSKKPPPVAPAGVVASFYAVKQG
jgi:hypothetical protein